MNQHHKEEEIKQELSEDSSLRTSEIIQIVDQSFYSIQDILNSVEIETVVDTHADKYGQALLTQFPV